VCGVEIGSLMFPQATLQRVRLAVSHFDYVIENAA